MKMSNRSGLAVRGVVLCLILFSLVLSGCSTKRASDPSVDSSYLASLTKKEADVLEKQGGTILASVPRSERDLVADEYRIFLHNKRKIVAVNSRRSEKYLGVAREVFRSHGMPEELAYLAIVESGFNPKAKSKAGAAGAWQFMPATATKYGLARNNFVDERYDVYASTVAAARYLKKLYAQFHDWPTAIAAYNAGEGKISRALEASGEDTFFGIVENNHKLGGNLRLKDETCRYVPRLIAMIVIMENLDELGFKSVNLNKAPTEVRLRVRPGTDLKAMARACRMSWSDFSSLNPHHKTGVSSTLQTTNVYVPTNTLANAVAYVNNPVIVDRAVASRGAKKAASAKGKGSSTLVCTGSYCIAPGETLSSVARKHNTTVEVLMAANRISDPHQVKSGTRLKVPASSTASRSSSTKKAGYRVQANDNLWRISQKTGVSVAQLKRLNNLDGEHIYAGQHLVVQ